MTAFMEIGAADQVISGRGGKSGAVRPKPAFISSQSQPFGKKNAFKCPSQLADRHFGTFHSFPPWQVSLATPTGLYKDMAGKIK